MYHFIRNIQPVDYVRFDFRLNEITGIPFKKKRLELKLRQVDVARLLNTTEDSVRFWETDRSKPQINLAPRIIKFLGYNPYLVGTNAMGGRIKHYRILHGLSHKKMGQIIGVDAATISTWETGKLKPNDVNLKRLQEILTNGFGTV